MDPHANWLVQTIDEGVTDVHCIAGSIQLVNHDADSLAGIELAFQIDRRPLQEHQRMSRDLTDWDETQPHEFGTFGDIQPLCSTGRTFSSSVFEQRLIELAGKTGRLLDDVAANRVEHNRDVLTGHLVEIFRALVSAADEVNVNLDQVARRNVAKTISRWPSLEQRLFPPLFEDRDDLEERLPRRIEMDIAERGSEDRKYVCLRCNELNIGDRLTDNKAEEDDYRFHDVFHLAYAAILGWSPVTRALFKVKRKGNGNWTRPRTVRERPWWRKESRHRSSATHPG